MKEGENELPKLEERRRVALSDREKYRSLLEQLQTHKQNLQSKIDARIEEERRLKVGYALRYRHFRRSFGILSAILTCSRPIMVMGDP